MGLAEVEVGVLDELKSRFLAVALQQLAERPSSIPTFVQSAKQPLRKSSQARARRSISSAPQRYFRCCMSESTKTQQLKSPHEKKRTSPDLDIRHHLVHAEFLALHALPQRCAQPRKQERWLLLVDLRGETLSKGIVIRSNAWSEGLTFASHNFKWVICVRIFLMGMGVEERWTEKEEGKSKFETQGPTDPCPFGRTNLTLRTFFMIAS